MSKRGVPAGWEEHKHRVYRFHQPGYMAQVLPVPWEGSCKWEWQVDRTNRQGRKGLAAGQMKLRADAMSLAEWLIDGLRLLDEATP